ncbi:MAG TPA: glycosyltransferase family 1 protein, partial [Balneolales bacterium]|nr:glycosyltransferase family 1 protein [Balneolales bacterium]
MRILIDTSSITKRRTGTGTYSSGLLKSLLMIPDVEHVLAVGGEIDRESLDHQEKLIHLFPGDTRWHYLLNNVWTGNRYNWDANLAFFPNYFMPFAFPIRSIVTIHDVSFLSHPECYSRRMRTWYAYRIKQTVSHADQILTVSESSRLDIMHYLGIPGNRIQVIEPGSSLSHHDKPDAFRKIKNHNRFLYIGTIEPRKNIIKMLRGFSAAKSPDLQLQMAGQIHCSRSYWRRVQALISADRRIRYLGYVSDKRLQKELSDCDALVNLSQIEGFGLPVMEGLLYGKGCLVSEDPALLSLAGKHGVKVCGYHIKEITRGFERMRCSLAAIGEDDPAKLRSYYSWMRFARQLIPVVQRQTEVICLPFAENPDSAQAFGVTGLQRAIIEALTYSAVFRCPLTLNQLYQRLPVVKCTYQEFVKSLKQLCYNYPNIFRVDDRYVYLEPFDIGAGKRDSDLADNAIFINRHAKVIR